MGRWPTDSISAAEWVRTTSVRLSSRPCATGRILLTPGGCTPIARLFLYWLFRHWWIPNVRIFIFLLVSILRGLFNEHLVVDHWLVAEDITNVLVLLGNV
jgi:hypothetical protein